MTVDIVSTVVGVATEGAVRRRSDEPMYCLADAIAAAQRIHALRVEGGDDDADLFPLPVVDDDDVDTVVGWVESHRNIRARVAVAELPHRALLVEYQRQRDMLRYKRRVLAVLRSGHRLKALPGSYGPQFGLPTRYAVYVRRVRLEQEIPEIESELRRKQESSRSAGEDTDEGFEVWLEWPGRRETLVDVAEGIIDHRDELLVLVRDPGIRAMLAAAIDDAGLRMSQRPTPGFAKAVVQAMLVLRKGGPAKPSTDPILQELIRRGQTLT